jgi:hypothetical protein
LFISAIANVFISAIANLFISAIANAVLTLTLNILTAFIRLGRAGPRRGPGALHIII